MSRLRGYLCAMICVALVAAQPACGQLPGGRTQKPPESSKPARTDCYGDPLPPGAIARLGTMRLRHLIHANDVAFSPDGAVLASSGADGLIRLWEPATGQQIRLLAGHLGPI